MAEAMPVNSYHFWNRVGEIMDAWETAERKRLYAFNALVMIGQEHQII